jgi:hypothetical protein
MVSAAMPLLCHPYTVYPSKRKPAGEDLRAPSIAGKEWGGPCGTTAHANFTKTEALQKRL